MPLPETQPSSNLTSEPIEWAKDEFSKPRTAFDALKSGPYGPLFKDLSIKLSTEVPRQLLWHVMNNNLDQALCSCGSPRKWVKNLNSYRHTCGSKCAGKMASARSPRKEPIKKDPWYKDPERVAEITEKRRKATLEKYGVDHHRKRPEISEKIRQTNIERYGSPTPSGNAEIKQKSRNTFAENYSNNEDNLRDLVDKRKQTNIVRYGVEHPMMSDEIKNRLADTILGRYGVRHALQNKNLNDKRKSTNLERYGCEEPIASPAVKMKIAKTVQDRYGYDNWRKSIVSKWAMEILSDPVLFSTELCGMTLDQAKDHLGVSLRTVLNYASKHALRGIFSKVKITTSEILIKDLLTELIGFDNFEMNRREIIAPMELDFFIPDKNLAIEVNGLYWHSEIGGGRGRSYHFTKWKRCLEKNITLLQFSSFEIQNKFELVKSRIKRYLGISVPVVGSRKLSIEMLDNYQIERDFLDEWHLQGSTTNRNFVLAAYHQGEMVAISTWKINKNIAELVRFATRTDQSYPGLLSRMIKRFVCETGFFGTIISYSSNNYGFGKLYASSGFSRIGYTAPGYRYTTDYTDTYSRLEFQKHKLRELFGLDDDYVSIRSEWEIMQDFGFDRVWDSGNTKWKLDVAHTWMI
jgi:hypothetical protein